MSYIIHSRPRATSDWTCPRSRYWGYEYMGRGLVRDNMSLNLFLGGSIHDALAAIAVQHPNVDINQIATATQASIHQTIMEHAIDGADEAETQLFGLEQGALVEGMIRGFYKHVWPRLIAQYPIIKAVEQEMIYPHGDGMIFMAKPDLVVADAEGSIFYIEYKSTSSKKPEWINSWNTAIQLHATVRCIEHSLGEPVSGVIVQGLYKGFESYGKQSSPFCYAYKKNGNPPFTEDIISYDYKPGFKRTATWELPGGVEAWVEGMAEEVLAGQFPQTPPIHINNDLVDAFFMQRAHREREIQDAVHVINSDDVSDETKSVILDQTFPQIWDACSPAWGYGCGFKHLCHGQVDRPLEQGWLLRDVTHEEPFQKLIEEADAKS